MQVYSFIQARRESRNTQYIVELYIVNDYTQVREIVPTEFLQYVATDISVSSCSIVTMEGSLQLGTGLLQLSMLLTE